MKNSGLTLVELLVSLALFGIVSAGFASLFAEHARLSARSFNESDLTERSDEFQYKLRTLLSNSTAVFACNCPNRCAINLSETLPEVSTAEGSRTVLLDFDAETSEDPSIRSPDGCVFGGSETKPANLPSSAIGLPGPVPSEPIIFKGCKKRFQLVYYPPGPASPSKPGKLQIELMSLSPSDSTVIRSIESLEGVYGVSCGHPEQPDSLLATGSRPKTTDAFFIQIQLKSRSSNTADYKDGAGKQVQEGFARGTPGFELGWHRTLTLRTSFKNITQRGIYFGAPTGTGSCIRDGQFDANGNCCSGFRRADGTCMKADTCVRRGDTPSNPDAEWGFSECCSHVMADGVCA